MPEGPSVRGAQMERLEAFAAPARAAGLRVDTVLEEGLAADVILGRAAALRPRLVALGTGRRGRLGEWIMGSTAERVVRRSPVPVLTVPADAARPVEGVRGVLCAIDFAATGTLAAAREMAQRCTSALTVLHVVEPATADAEGPRREAEQRLRAALNGGYEGPAATATVRVGAAAGQIVAAAEEAGVDVVVVGLRDPRRWPAELPHVGSTASEVMRRSTCAVVTVPGAFAPLAPVASVALAASRIAP
jgi:nucleotide-binding universal stress UspA family protein